MRNTITRRATVHNYDADNDLTFESEKSLQFLILQSKKMYFCRAF